MDYHYEFAGPEDHRLQRVEYLRRGLVGVEHHQDYLMSAMFKAQIDALVQLLPMWVEGIAAYAARNDVEARRLMEKMMMVKPAVFTPEQLAGMGIDMSNFIEPVHVPTPEDVRKCKECILYSSGWEAAQRDMDESRDQADPRGKSQNYLEGYDDNWFHFRINTGHSRNCKCEGL